VRADACLTLGLASREKSGYWHGDKWIENTRVIYHNTSGLFRRI
jgi:hypothetical protein